MLQVWWSRQVISTIRCRIILTEFDFYLQVTIDLRRTTLQYFAHTINVFYCWFQSPIVLTCTIVLKLRLFSVFPHDLSLKCLNPLLSHLTLRFSPVLPLWMISAGFSSGSVFEAKPKQSQKSLGLTSIHWIVLPWHSCPFPVVLIHFHGYAPIGND